MRTFLLKHGRLEISYRGWTIAIATMQPVTRIMVQGAIDFEKRLIDRRKDAVFQDEENE